MSSQQDKTLLYGGAAGILALGAIAYAMFRSKGEEKKEEPTEVIALLGDVGGTNIRLTLRTLNLKTRTSTELVPLTKIASQEVESFEAAVKMFLKVSFSLCPMF